METRPVTDGSPDTLTDVPWRLPPIAAPESEAVIPFAFSREELLYEQAKSPHEALLVDFVRQRSPVNRILVLKLDHFGDFIIGLPALHALRNAYPHATIRLVCGRWNERNALACGLVDEVRVFNFFPEHPQNGDPAAADPLRVLEEVVAGAFDLAIDLRVDEDTRPLLARVNARLRCGIGSASRFPLLDIALPDEHFNRSDTSPDASHSRYLAPGAFNSALPEKTPLQHFGKLRRGDLVQGPHVELPPGRLLAVVRVRVAKYLPNPVATSVKIDVVRDGGEVVATQIFGRLSIHRLRRDPVVFEFDNESELSKYEFRIQVAGRPLSGEIFFSGVTVQRHSLVPAPRLRPVELHIGEKMSLLIALVRERTSDLYRDLLPVPAVSQPVVPRKPGLLRIVVAPFSNSSTRDWPASYYARLIASLLEQLSCEIILLGTETQVAASNELAAKAPSPRLLNLTGRTAWGDLPDLLRNCDLVVCNNSGVAHLAAAVGAPVLALYSGSHQPQEWGPRGMRSAALMHPIHCSPCGFERVVDCPMEHACMKEIRPDYVLAQVKARISGTPVSSELTSA